LLHISGEILAVGEHWPKEIRGKHKEIPTEPKKL
jgi:hypothetical protein